MPTDAHSELLLIIFIHGFKGTDSTFGQFPERLQHIVSQGTDNLEVESIVFPAYETKGELNQAVERFADWLTTLTVEREVAKGSGGGAGKAKIVLCGHSMGGLLAADTLINLASSRSDPQAPLWPNIIACIAFDTPYLGIHPHVFKHGATKAMEYVQTAQKVASSLGFFSSRTTAAKGAETLASTSLKAPLPIEAPAASSATTAAAAAASSSKSSWAKWTPAAAYSIGGALASGALAGAAYYQRDKLGLGYSWATDHMKYVGTLWDEKRLTDRMQALMQLQKSLKVTFRTFYTLLPPQPPTHPLSRTFCILPEQHSELSAYFSPAQNTVASDEVDAHVSMFEASKNDGYYALGLAAAELIREAVDIHRNMEGAGAEAEGHSIPIQDFPSWPQDAPGPSTNQGESLIDL